MGRTTAKRNQAFEGNDYKGKSRKSGEEIQACSDGSVRDELRDGAEEPI
jgi:hypothetical protein